MCQLWARSGFARYSPFSLIKKDSNISLPSGCYLGGLSTMNLRNLFKRFGEAQTQFVTTGAANETWLYVRSRIDYE